MNGFLNVWKIVGRHTSGFRNHTQLRLFFFQLKSYIKIESEVVGRVAEINQMEVESNLDDVWMLMGKM
jgi:hypothetical protein